MKRIKTGDTVKVITGSLKGTIAEVEKISGDKVYLKGVNLVERHYRATAYSQAGKREIHVPIHISNVALVVDGDKATKVSYKIVDGKKVRVAKINQKEIK